jgi:hypothetical protein
MENSIRNYKEKFPTVVSIFIGILMIFVLYSILAAPGSLSQADLLLGTGFTCMAVLLVLHCWLVRTMKNSYLAWGLGPIIGIYWSIKYFKEIKYLSIPYLIFAAAIIAFALLMPAEI